MAEGKSKFLERVNKRVKKWVECAAAEKGRRFGVLLVCGGIGLLLGVGIVRWGILNYLFPDCGGSEYHYVRNSLVGVIIGLPVFVVLWVFRTMDTREQINKTEEQINKTQEQINFGFFSDARKLFLSKGTLKERTVGFIQLAQLQQQGLFVEKIKIIFRGGKLNRPENGEGAYLKGIDLKGIDLSDTGFGLGDTRFGLEGADLEGADLEGADLQGADLQGADLQRANLEEANLIGANLQGTRLGEANLKRAELQGAQFDNITNVTNANLEGTFVTVGRRNGSALTDAGVVLSETQSNQLEHLA